MELRKSEKERGEDRGFKPQRRAPKGAFYLQNNRVSIRSDDEVMGHLPTTFPEFLSSILKMSFFRSGSWESVTADSLLLLNKLKIAESQKAEMRRVVIGASPTSHQPNNPTACTVK